MALGVPWAQEGQLTQFLLGLLLVLFLPCCPAKGTRKKHKGTDGTRCHSPCLGLANSRQHIPSHIPKPSLGSGHRCSPVSGAGALRDGGLPSSGIPYPGCPHTTLEPGAMYTVATRGSSKIINVTFFACITGSDAVAELSTEGRCSQASLCSTSGLQVQHQSLQSLSPHLPSHCWQR